MPITTPWTIVTPTLGGGTLGDGTLTARYRRNRGCFEIQGQLLWGSTTTGINSYIQLDVEPLPFPSVGWGAPSNYLTVPLYGALALSASFPDDQIAAGVMRVLFTTTELNALCTRIRCLPVFGTRAISATHPFTWTAGSFLTFGNVLEAFDN